MSHRFNTITIESNENDFMNSYEENDIVSNTKKPSLLHNEQHYNPNVFELNALKGITNLSTQNIFNKKSKLINSEIKVSNAGKQITPVMDKHKNMIWKTQRKENNGRFMH